LGTKKETNHSTTFESHTPLLAFHTTELRVAPPDSNLKLLIINHTLGTLTFGRAVRLQLRAALSGLIAQARMRKRPGLPCRSGPARLAA
jgi:hypothetical protein